MAVTESLCQPTIVKSWETPLDEMSVGDCFFIPYFLPTDVCPNLSEVVARVEKFIRSDYTFTCWAGDGGRFCERVQ